MKLHHIAIWTYKLEELRDFYTRYINGKSNQKYVNSAKALNLISLLSTVKRVWS